MGMQAPTFGGEYAAQGITDIMGTQTPSLGAGFTGTSNGAAFNPYSFNGNFAADGSVLPGGTGVSSVGNPYSYASQMANTNPSGISSVNGGSQPAQAVKKPDWNKIGQQVGQNMQKSGQQIDAAEQQRRKRLAELVRQFGVSTSDPTGQSSGWMKMTSGAR